MTNPNLPVLKGRRVTLRPPRAEDFEGRLRLGSDAEIFRMYGGSRGDLPVVTEEAAKRWVRRLLDLEYAWIIEVDILIGHIRLDHLDLSDRRASLAIGIDDKAQLGIGFGMEAINLPWDTHSTFSNCIESRCVSSITICGQSTPTRNAGLSRRGESARQHSSMASGTTT
jgi:hypothetical protein